LFGLHHCQPCDFACAGDGTGRQQKNRGTRTLGLWGKRDFVLAAMRDGFWQKFTVKAGDEVTGRANGKRRDDKNL
jgi:hypothetical protein